MSSSSTTDAADALSLSTDRSATANAVIAAMAGPDARLRADQTTAVAALCEDGARVLVVQATGWGKSAVYWAATAIRRAEGAGPTLVVSPLLSLMRDQVAAAGRAGLKAATLNSSNIDAWSSIEAELVSGALDVLLVSPERLANPGFGRRVLDGLAGRLGLLVIDEAHAVSDWGHDFRPDYRRVSDVLQKLNPDTPVLATTATANERVTVDVAHQLGESTLVLRGALARDGELAARAVGRVRRHQPGELDEVGEVPTRRRQPLDLRLGDQLHDGAFRDIHLRPVGRDPQLVQLDGLGAEREVDRGRRAQ